MNLLIKNTQISYIPGSPGVPADPGAPYSPPYTSFDPVVTCAFEPAVPGLGNYYQVSDGQGGYTYIFIPSGGGGVQVPQMVWRCSTKNVATYHPGVAGRPPTPGVPPSPSSIVVGYNLGWNAGARSIKEITGNGYMLFTVPGSIIGAVVGLSSSDLDGGYRGIAHAFYLGGGVARILELGVVKAYVGPFTSGAEFVIERLAGVVTYWLDGDLVYTSETPSEGIVFIDTSFYAGGDSIENPALESTTTVESFLPHLAASGGDVAFAMAAVSLPSLSVAARVAVGGVTVMPHLLTIAYDREFGDSQASLPAMTVSAEGGLPVPPYAVADSVLTVLSVSAHGLTGEVGGVTAAPLPALDTLAADHAYGEVVAAELPALLVTGFGGEGNTNATLASFAAAGDVFTGAYEIMVFMGEHGTFTATMVAGVVSDAALMSGATVTGAMTSTQIAQAVMNSLAVGDDGGPVWDQPAAAWVVNYDTSASSTYENFPFNSYAKVGEKYFGATADGIYLLDGDDDAGSPIRASVNFGKSKLGTTALKRLADCYLGVSSTDTMYLKITVDGQPYTYVARRSDEAMQLQRVDIGKGLKANYFTFEVYNNDGCDFELDKVEFRLAELTRRI